MTEQQLIKKIDSLYSQYLNEYEYNQILDQMKKNKKIVSRLIFDMIEKSDIKLTKFLIGLLGDIEDTGAINKLIHIIKDPNMSDELKLVASASVQQLGGEMDFEQLLQHLNDPVALGKQVVENLLENSTDLLFMQKFLEDFPQVHRDVQIASIEDLSVITDDERLLNIADPLSDMVDDELKLKIIPLLVNSHHPRAFTVLQRIIRRTKSKQIQTAAQQAIFQLGKFVSQNQADRTPEFKFNNAHITSVDGDGSCICLFAVTNKEKEIICLDFVANSELGIKDAFGIIQNKESFREFMNQFKQEPGFFITKAPASVVIDKAKEAEELAAKLNRPLPLEYLAYRKILEEVSFDEKPGKELADLFQEFREKTLKRKDEIFPKTSELFNYEEISHSWFVGMEKLDALMDDYVEASLIAAEGSEMSDPKNIRDIVKKTSKKVFTREFKNVLVKRLHDFSFISFIAKKTLLAELSLVAAETLLQHESQNHPFLYRMIVNSFNISIIENMLFDEDEEDEFEDDDFDEFDDDLFQDFESEYYENDVSYEVHPKKRFDSLELNLPESANLPCFDKLLLLAKKMPNSDFAKFFDPNIKSKDLETKIKHVNYLQSAFNGFVTYYTNYFEWNNLRKYLNISFKRKYFNDELKYVENMVITNMKEYEYHQYYIDYAKRIWTEAVLLSKGDLKPMKKPISWSAAVEYLTGCQNPDRYSMQETADDYEISVSTLSKRVKDLKKILNIKVYNNDEDEFAFLSNEDNL